MTFEVFDQKCAQSKHNRSQSLGFFFPRFSQTLASKTTVTMLHSFIEFLFNEKLNLWSGGKSNLLVKYQLIGH